MNGETTKVGSTELAHVLSEMNEQGGFPIAVLTDRQAVDLTKDGKETAYQRILHGIAAAGLDPASTFTWDKKRPPYPGLMAFQEEDAAIFFGRGDEITQGLELLNRLRHLGEPRVVMILGASGTGKSNDRLPF